MAVGEFSVLDVKGDAEFAAAPEIAASPGRIPFHNLAGFARWANKFFGFRLSKVDLKIFGQFKETNH